MLQAPAIRAKRKGLYCCVDGKKPFTEVRAACLGFVLGSANLVGFANSSHGSLRVRGVRKCDSSGGSQTSLGKFGSAKVRLWQCAGSIVYIPLPLCLLYKRGRTLGRVAVCRCEWCDLARNNAAICWGNGIQAASFVSCGKQCPYVHRWSSLHNSSLTRRARHFVVQIL